MSDTSQANGTLCGWCIVGDHQHHRPGMPASPGGMAWHCSCAERVCARRTLPAVGESDQAERTLTGMVATD